MSNGHVEPRVETSSAAQAAIDYSQLVYEPVGSVQDFLQDESFISVICGPVGSTKTTAGIMKIAYHAARMAKSRDGIRRSRCMWVRNTRQQLSDTSLPDFLKWFPDGVAGDFHKTEYRFILRFDDVECEVIWRPLETADDVRRVLSTQLSFAILEEVREINADVAEALQGRLGRYPDGMMVPHRPEWGLDDKGNPIQGCVTDEGKPNKHMWAMTNPPDMDSYWEQFMSNPPSNAKVYIQPSGLSAEADWVHLLPSNYYEDLMQGKTQDYIDVYIHAKFGKSLSGQPVFRAFSPDRHIPPEPIQFARHLDSPLIIGFDCGLNPTAVICQVDYRGRLLVLSALTSDGMGALRFCQTVLKPTLANRFSGMKCIVVADPAGQQRAQTDERTVFDILKVQGFRVVPAKTNALSARISAVDNFLTRTVDDAPMILFDKEGAKPLIQSMRGKYRYKLNKDGSMPDSPEKSHPWSDLADALQYACLHADSSHIGGNTRVVAKKVVKVNYRYV
jgi:hypothetical protein